MGAITKNLSWREVLRGSGYDGLDDVPFGVLDRMERAADAFQALRDAWGDSLNIVSGGGLRSEEMNDRVGGSDKSRHVQGDAFDLKLPGRRPNRDYLKLYELIDAMQRDGRLPKGGLGAYWHKGGKKNKKTGDVSVPHIRFIHFDVRGYVARWNSRHKKRAYAYFTPE